MNSELAGTLDRLRSGVSIDSIPRMPRSPRPVSNRTVTEEDLERKLLEALEGHHHANTVAASAILARDEAEAKLDATIEAIARGYLRWRSKADDLAGQVKLALSSVAVEAGILNEVKARIEELHHRATNPLTDNTFVFGETL